MDLNTVTHQLALELNRQALMQITIKPSQPILLLEKVTEDEVCKWLASRGSQEFARHSIKDDSDRREVAQWFIGSLRDFYTFQANSNPPNVG